MPEELLDAQARERLMNIFAGGTLPTPTLENAGNHAMDAAHPTLENVGTPIADVLRTMGLDPAPAPHGRHATGAPILEAAVPAPEPELLSDMIEDCFIEKEVLRRHSGRDVGAYLWGAQRTTDHGIPEQRFPIPDEDLIIIEKLYHGRFPDGGRKRGALMRYIKFFKDQLPERTDFFSKLKRQLERS